MLRHYLINCPKLLQTWDDAKAVMRTRTDELENNLLWPRMLKLETKVAATMYVEAGNLRLLTLRTLKVRKWNWVWNRNAKFLCRVYVKTALIALRFSVMAPRRSQLATQINMYINAQTWMMIKERKMLSAFCVLFEIEEGLFILWSLNKLFHWYHNLCVILMGALLEQSHVSTLRTR